MVKIKVIDGVYWIDIPEENLFILCGCPADIIKHLMKKGNIDQARTQLFKIYNWFSEGFDTADLIEAKKIYDKLSLEKTL